MIEKKQFDDSYFVATRGCEVMQEFSSEALASCFINGVVKLEGVIGESDLVRLDSMRQFNIFTLDQNCPDSQKIPDVVDLYESMTSYTKRFIPGFSFEQPNSFSPHKDSAVQGGGVTMLIPVSGPPAAFYFSENVFTRKEDATGSVMYKPGDVLIMRQDIPLLNGSEPVMPLQKLYHTAEAADVRKLLVIDIISKDWHL